MAAGAGGGTGNTAGTAGETEVVVLPVGTSEARYFLVVGVSILIAAALIVVAWGIRSLVRVVARPLRRVIPHQAATALAYWWSS